MSCRFGKGYKRESHRMVAPEETLARLGPLLPAMGITRVANVTGLDRIGIPVVMVSRPNSRSVSVSQGKGLTLVAAKASGIMESVETWHAERISRPLRHACRADLAAELAADLGSEASVVEVARLPRTRPVPFDDDLRLLWIEGSDVATGERLWLPYEMVHTDYTVPADTGHDQFHRSSNGLASGNGPLEATCHAVCELIERDATTLWHHMPERARRERRIRPETVEDPACLEAMRRLERAAMDLAIFETTSDVAVSSFRCLISERERRGGHIGIGDGCHPHRGIALLRALTEAVQTRMTYISGARDDIFPDEFTDAAIRKKNDFVRSLVDGGEAQRSFLDCPHLASDSFREDLDWLLARLRAVSCGQAIAIDLSRPEIGVAVVRVVIPGLEAPHDDDSYVPGPRCAAAAP